MTLKRLTTGNRPLDEILDGGFPIGSLNLIMGSPGTGKTMLAEQFAFANASEERPALYLTTLSEPLEKLIAHGQTYSFFDTKRIGHSVHYEDLGLTLRESGLEALPTAVADLLVRYRPAVLVIDSFKALSDLDSRQEVRRSAVFDLASVLAAYDCTTLLVGEYADDSMSHLPEFAIADGVVQLRKQSSGLRQERFLRIEKMRGANVSMGSHAFSITANGLEVYPRLTTPHVPADYVTQRGRLKTGIVPLDVMIDSGFLRGSTTLIAGPSGSGKTILGLHFLRQGLRDGEVGLFAGFQENPQQLAGMMRSFGWDPAELLHRHRLEFLYRSPVEMQLDSIAAELCKGVQEGNVQRVVVDSIGDLRRAATDIRRFNEFIYSFSQWCATRNVTCILNHEVRELFEFHEISAEEVSNISDNIVLLRFKPGEEMARTVRIIKTRGSGHDHRERVFEITPRGIELSQNGSPRR